MSGLELRIPPPAIAVAAAVFMWRLALGTPALALAIPARRAIATAMALVGVAIVLAGALEFRRARTTLNPLNPGAASALVVARIYRHTRNPMYLGMAIILLAWSIYLSNPLALLGTAAFVAYITRFQIIPEEQALRALFPEEFGRYARAVRRWI